MENLIYTKVYIFPSGAKDDPEVEEDIISYWVQFLKVLEC